MRWSNRKVRGSFGCLSFGSIYLAALTLIGTTSSFAEGFTKVTETAGVDYLESRTINLEARPYWQELMTGGAAAGDYDGDGWVDLVVSRRDDTMILFRNLGDGTFENVTAEAKLDAVQSRGSNGMAWGDIDNDGDLDLYVTSFDDRRFYLYVNDGNGTFKEEGRGRGASLEGANPHYGQSAAFGDYNLDGYLDLFVTEWRHDDETNNPNNHPSHNRLLRNRGSSDPGYFEDVTDEAGVNVDGFKGNRVPPGSWGFAPRFSDLDGDGFPDLALVADFGEGALFWNNGDGTFSNGTQVAEVNLEENAMGSTIGDFNGDGLLDWFVTAIFEEESETATGNRLYLNNGDRTFTDATDSARVREGFWGWGTSGFDFDNDGDLDIMMANGWQDAEPFRFDPIVLWENDGSGRFTSVGPDLGVTDIRSGRGLLTFDYDRDGDLDVFVTNNNEHPVLYRNDIENGNNWLRVRTVGTLSNRNGIGVFVTLMPDVSDPQSIVVREIDGGSNFLSQNEMIAHFGLGDQTEPIERLTVNWPSGIVQVFESVPVNSLLVAREYSASGLLRNGEARLVDDGTEFMGNTYNGFELASEEATFSSAAGEITRISFLDPDGDLVFAEFGSDHSATTLTIHLENFREGVPSPYRQPGTFYAQGLASFTIENPTELTFFSVFSLGNDPTRVDNSLIAEETFGGSVNGLADVKRLSLKGGGTYSEMGGINAANANFTAGTGFFGIDASNHRVRHFLFVGDITPSGSARPVLRVSAESTVQEIQINGGDLREATGEYAIDTNGMVYPFPVKSMEGRRSISNSPSRPDLGDGTMPRVTDTFMSDRDFYFETQGQK